MKNIIGFEKKKMLLLTKEELKSHQNAKTYHNCRNLIIKKIANGNGINNL